MVYKKRTLKKRLRKVFRKKFKKIRRSMGPRASYDKAVRNTFDVVRPITTLGGVVANWATNWPQFSAANDMIAVGIFHDYGYVLNNQYGSTYSIASASEYNEFSGIYN